jgi:hypothetical protein
VREKNNDASQFINQSSIGKKVLEDVKSKYADKVIILSLFNPRKSSKSPKPIKKSKVREKKR